jgi:hypothetical protein
MLHPDVERVLRLVTLLVNAGVERAARTHAT